MSLINNRNEESTPEFEVISGGKEDVRSSFADRTEQEAEIDLIDLAWALLDKIHYIVLCFFDRSSDNECIFLFSCSSDL